MNEWCVVTGGAGFIGSNLVDKLIESGKKVIVIDNLSSGKMENLKHKESDNFILIKEDICNNLESIFKKHSISVVFHFAAIPRVQYSILNPMETNKTNIEGTLNLLDHCKRFGIKRFVFSSSSSIYGDQDKLPLHENMPPNPMSPYALQKLVGEFYCTLYWKIHGIETISLRYFNVYGPKQDPNGNYATLIAKFIKLFKNKERPLINGDGKQTRDFTYVQDVVNSNILAASTSNQKCFGESFNIGGGTNLSVNEVVNKIKELTNSSVEPIYGPSVIEPKDTLADISKVRELLGWTPEVEFDEGLMITNNTLLV